MLLKEGLHAVEGPGLAWPLTTCSRSATGAATSTRTLRQVAATPSSPEAAPPLPAQEEPTGNWGAREQAQPLRLGLLKLPWAHPREPRTCRCLVPAGLKEF